MDNARATGADIIEAMINNLHSHLEPIYYTAQAPSLYHVYLHGSDFARLNGIFPQIISEAKRALDDEMKKLNRKGVVESMRAALQKRLAPVVKDRFAGKPNLSYQPPIEGWQIAFYLDADGELKQGDVAIVSELAAPPQIEYGEGNPTMTVRTIKRAEQVPMSEPAQSIPIRKRQAKKSAMPKPTQAHSAQSTDVTVQAKIYAVIRYSDVDGAHTFEMTKNAVVIGRGGKNQNVDLKLKTDPRVSREHLRLSRDERTGKFYIKDLSTYGVTVNGEKIHNKTGEAKDDRNTEIALPARARIVLADVVTLEFQAIEDVRGNRDETLC